MSANSTDQHLSEPETRSYSTILKSSSLVGSAEFLKILIGLIRVKVAAVVLGPEGIGLIGLFNSSTLMVGVLSGLGIRSSAVRDVSQAHAANDAKRLSRTIVALRRICWLTGLAGWLLTILFSRYLSIWTFGTAEHETAIAILGVTILFGQVSAGQEVLLRGTLRIKLLVLQSLLGAVAGAIASIILLVFFGRDGIVPALVVTALLALVFSWLFARRIPLDPVEMSLKQTAETGISFTKLGIAFMYTALLGAVVAWVIQAYLANNIGVFANGIYRSAWAISGQFAIFIMAAMTADYFPRLSAASARPEKMAKLVNEQTEIGILLALPGLVATLIFAPFLVRLLYSVEFALAADLIPWLVIGTFIRVIYWPMATVQIAIGAGRSYASTQTIGHLIHLALVIVLVNETGLIGSAFAFLLMNTVMIVVIKFTVERLIHFRWSSSVHGLLAVSGLTILAAFGIARLLPVNMLVVTGSFFVIICGFLCLRALFSRLGPDHWLSRAFQRVPFLIPKS